MSRPVSVVLVVLAVLAAGLVLGVWRLVRASQVRPDHLGWSDGGFAACSDMPNCVCSLAQDPRHAIEPIRYDGDPAQAMERLYGIVAALPNSAIVSRTDRYLHAEIRSPGLGYVDDLELYLDQTAGLIHVKSSARVPYYDFDVNRKRVASLRDAFARER